MVQCGVRERRRIMAALTRTAILKGMVRDVAARDGAATVQEGENVTCVMLKLTLYYQAHEIIDL